MNETARNRMVAGFILFNGPQRQALRLLEARRASSLCFTHVVVAKPRTLLRGMLYRQA
ncbi:hypothetical protein [Rhizobium sp. M1]|uniref:hypothetical protein n=1 Tax=Rhizobium sp. M1 TaxID=2035453 RepID=UPI0015967D9F|nr:hypothetical protein [Rhizobium sp. M1]